MPSRELRDISACGELDETARNYSYLLQQWQVITFRNSLKLSGIQRNTILTREIVSSYQTEL